MKSRYRLSDISMTNYPMGVGELCGAVAEGWIDPGRGEAWPVREASRFVESVLVGVRPPAFYFEEVSTRKWTVVDGRKRREALASFASGEFRLEGLEFRTDLEGQAWADLGFPDRRDFMQLPATVNVLRKGSPAWVRDVLARRLSGRNGPAQ